MLIGYARTSTVDQKAGLEAQVRDLRAAGAKKVFSEQVSSVAQRDTLKACLDYLREGDALVVTKPDRLAGRPRRCWRSRRICRSAASAWSCCRWVARSWTPGTRPASSC